MYFIKVQKNKLNNIEQELFLYVHLLKKAKAIMFCIIMVNCHLSQKSEL